MAPAEHKAGSNCLGLQETRLSESTTENHGISAPQRKGDSDTIMELDSLVKNCRIRQEPAERYLLIRDIDRKHCGKLHQPIRAYLVGPGGACKPLGDERGTYSVGCSIQYLFRTELLA